MPPRAPPWQHPDGVDASRQAILLVLQLHKQFVLDANLGMYKGTNFCIGMDQEKLGLAASVLRELLVLDARGGYFAQDDMAVAMGQVMNDVLPTLLQKAFTEEPTVPPDDVIPTIAFRLRVMLSHARVAFDSHEPKVGETHPLQILFDVMKFGKPLPPGRTIITTVDPIQQTAEPVH